MTYSTLISAADLSKHIFEPGWVILDCRHDLANPDAGTRAYTEGHLPNAQFAHLDKDLAGEKIGDDGVFRGRHPLPCLLYTSPSPRDQRGSRMPSSA